MKPTNFFSLDVIKLYFCTLKASFESHFCLKDRRASNQEIKLACQNFHSCIKPNRLKIHICCHHLIDVKIHTH